MFFLFSFTIIVSPEPRPNLALGQLDPEMLTFDKSIMPKHAQPGAPAIGAAGTRVQAANAATKRSMLLLVFFSPTDVQLYQRKQKINRQIHENGEETGR